MTRGIAAADRRGSQDGGRTARKRAAILEAATTIFLRDGYLDPGMDEIAELADVSKQTIYKQFIGKEALFIEIVAGLTSAGSDQVHLVIVGPAPGDDLLGFLEDYACRQLSIVLTPRLMQLRRMVIGEARRFPQLGKALYDSGPGRVMETTFRRLAGRAELRIADAAPAASQFNWLVMAQPLNQAMLLGDAAMPEPAALRRHAADAVRVFLAACGTG